MKKASILLACALMIVGASAVANGQEVNLGIDPSMQRPHVATEPTAGDPGVIDGVGNNWLQNLRGGTDWRIFPPPDGAALGNPPVFFPIYQMFSVDFSSDAQTLYGLDWLDPIWTFGTIDTTTSDFTPIAEITGDAAGDFMSGLAIDPTNETFYICGSGTLYTLDPGTAVSTIVNTFSAGFMIEIAFDCSGQMYAHNLTDNSLYSVDKTTADVTFIGDHGQGATNFAQGMDFDYATDTLYAPLYTGGGTGKYGTWDTSDGSFTVIIDTLQFNIEAMMAVRNPASACAGGGCVGDLDGDGDTDLADLGILLADFGCTAPGPCPGDLDNDGDTDLADLGILLADFGCTP